MKKQLLWIVGIVVIIALGAAGYFVYFRPVSMQKLQEKQKEYGNVVFSMNRAVMNVETEEWEFRERGVVYFAKTVAYFPDSKEKLKKLKYSEISSEQLQVIQRVAALAPTAVDYKCFGPGKVEIEKIWCTGPEMGLEFHIGECKIGNDCPDFTDVGPNKAENTNTSVTSDTASHEIGLALDSLLKEIGVTTFTR